MKIAFYIRKLLIGGSIINAVNLAGTMKRRGHEVLFVAETGDVQDLLDRHGVRHAPIRWYGGRHPKLDSVETLARILREFGPDVVHSWEDAVPGVIEVSAASLLWNRFPLVSTFMGNHIYREFRFPQCAVTTIAVPSLIQEALEVHDWSRPRLKLWNARIDLEQARSEPDKIQEFKSHHGLNGKRVLLTTVRLAYAWKWHYVQTLLSAFGEIARRYPEWILVVAGDGPARVDAEILRDRINHQAGRDAVRLIGWITDNHTAYASADVVVGQGSTLLWALGHGKPAVTVGTNGYSALLEPESIDLLEFMHFYSDKAVEEPVPRLASILERVLSDSVLRERLEAFGPSYVARFSIDQGAKEMEALYEEAISSPVPRSTVIWELMRAIRSYESFRARRHLVRRLTDGDFELKPKMKNYLVFPRDDEGGRHES